MALSDDHIKKRLKLMNCSQESVQTVAEWILRYKETIDQIARCWMDLYKEGNDSTRIALIFVMNDVVQKAMKKGASFNVITMAFHPHVINAIGISSPSVKKSISRCIEIFNQRKVFPSHIIDEMKSALISEICMERDKDEITDIDNLMLIRQIENFHQNEVLTEKARDILSKTDFNFKSTIEGRIKERIEGQKLLLEMEAAKQKLVTFLNSVEKHQNKGIKLITTLNQLKNSFNHQLKDVVLVNDAYEKFAKGIQDTKGQLEKMIDSDDLPGRQLSPPLDAPSPTPNDDPFAYGIQSEENGVTDDIDMEMDEDFSAPDKTAFHALIPPNKYIAPIPPVPTVDPRLQKFLNNTQGVHTGQPPVNINDPRQSKLIAPQAIASASNVNISLPPPPNYSQPPPMSGLVFQPQPPSTSSIQSVSVDTTHPPPFFNTPTENQTQAKNTMVNSSPFFHPGSMSNPPPLIGTNQMNIPLPSPTGTVGFEQHMPLRPPRPPSHRGLPPNTVPRSKGLNRPEYYSNPIQKRRESIEFDGSHNGPSFQKRRGWVGRGRGNENFRGRAPWNNNYRGNYHR